MNRNSQTRRSIEAVLSGQSPQKNYQQAYELALARLRKASLTQLEGVGALVRSASQVGLTVLGEELQINLAHGTVKDKSGQDVAVAWAILALHYLLSRPPQPSAERFISFMDIPEARGYARPYQGRVIGRFLRTAGKDLASFRAAAERLGPKELKESETAYEFLIFPRVRMRIIWYSGDTELGPGASFLYEQDIERVFCVEDIVVMSELVVKALSGK